MANNLINLCEAEFLAPFILDPEDPLLRRFWESLGGREAFYLTKWRQHRLTPLLYWQISRQGNRSALSPGLLQALNEDYAVALGKSWLQEREVRELLQSFQLADIEVILLKGIDLGHRVYGDPVVRALGDVDLMISRNSVRAVRDMLIGLGYRLEYSPESRYSKLRQVFSNYFKFLPPDGKIIPIDLHWEIHSDALVNRLTFNILREAALPADYSGVTVMVLDPEHLLLHLCLHTLDHSFHDTEANSDLGQKILDIAGVLDTLPINWRLFMLAVERFRCAPQVNQVLRRLSLLGNDKLPQYIFKSLRDQPLSLGNMVFWNLQKVVYSFLNKIPCTQRLKSPWKAATIFFSFLRSRHQSAPLPSGSSDVPKRSAIKDRLSPRYQGNRQNWD